jgi:uncharacterized protein DUF2418
MFNPDLKVLTHWFISEQASFVVHFLVLLSTINAFYTFRRKRSYRMFEASIDTAPSTPSARRVRVDSSPISSSLLRFLSNIFAPSTAESRSHPDPNRDVWELAVWDPLPLSVRLFCLFSPGHVLIYLLFPTISSDPRPSVTIVTTIILGALLSVQMSLLSSSFTRQAKDSTLLQKEVLNEYDKKFVHPRTQPLMRDVAVQFSEDNALKAGSDEKYNTVETFTPTHIVNRGFKTSPNRNYLSHIVPDKFSKQHSSPSWRQSPVSSSATSQQSQLHTPNQLRDSSPITQSHSTSIRQPQFRSTGDGGSLGVYSHANSPLRKSTSAYFDPRGQYNDDHRNKERTYSPLKRQSSPLKRSSVPVGMSTATAAQRLGHLSPDGF